MLRTWDLSATVAFYVDVLGFSRAGEAEGWASLQRDDVSLMFSGPNPHISEKSPCFTGSLYFRVVDVDGLWGQLHDHDGVTVCYPIETFDYGMREFAIFDNNGYILQFAEPVPSVGDGPG
jgi:uncharacterized glyoxalase superfamily protein PhnB